MFNLHSHHTNTNGQPRSTVCFSCHFVFRAQDPNKTPLTPISHAIIIHTELVASNANKLKRLIPQNADACSRKFNLIAQP